MLLALLATLLLLKKSLEHIKFAIESPTQQQAAAAKKQQQQQQQQQPPRSNIHKAATSVKKRAQQQQRQRQNTGFRTTTTTNVKEAAMSSSSKNNSNSTLAQQMPAINGDQVELADDADENTNSKPSIIVFKTGDKQCCHEITDRHVRVIGSNGKHYHGSSKVKLKNIVDYKWEVKNYPGHLIAVHIDGKHIAYVINVNNKASRMEGMIRVVNAQTGLRALIKGMSGEVLDLQFAHIEKDHILGSIDANSLYVHKIDMLNGTLLCNLIIKVEDPIENYTPKYDKLSWCPYIEVPSDDDEYSQMIVWARGSTFQCFNVNRIVGEHSIGAIAPDDISTGYLKFHDETLTISWVTLSPDGSTLGVGSTDGFIRFYQVYMHEQEPRCLHQWRPHDGKPISSFFFLDNLTKNGADTYWKYAITGASHNTEFKVWDCGTWECLQTVNITTDGGEESKKSKSPYFIADIDRTSSYLVLTSLETRNCYILQIVNNSSGSSETSICDSNNKRAQSNSSLTSDGGGSGSGGGGDAGETQLANARGGSRSNSKNTSISDNEDIDGNDNGIDNGGMRHEPMPSAYIKSITEFPLSSGILSFSIVDAVVRRYKCGNDNYLLWEELDDYDEGANSIFCVVLRMFIVQSKSMQECRILYQPTVADDDDAKSAATNKINNDEQQHSSKDGKSARDDRKGGGGGGSGDGASAKNKTEKVKNSKAKNKENNIKVEAVASADEANDDDEGVDDEVDDIIGTKQEAASDQNSIVALFSQWPLSGGNSNANTSQITVQQTTTITTSTSSVVALSTDDLMPSTPSSILSTSIKTEKQLNSRSTSPQSTTTTTGGGDINKASSVSPQVNLMTPDAFITSSSGGKKSPEGVNSDVLNTILMLASVTGQTAAPKNADAANLLKFNNHSKDQQKPMKQGHEKKFMVIGSNANRNVAENLASGGSSPSREVQEIMSQQDYDKSPYSGDDELILSEQVTKDDDVPVVAVSEELESNVDLLDANTKSSRSAKWHTNKLSSSGGATTTTTTTEKSNSTTAPTTNKHSAELQNAANLISQAVVNSGSHGMRTPPVLVSGTPGISGRKATTPIATATATKTGGSDNVDLADVDAKLKQLIDLVKVQSLQINSLHNEIAEMKKSNPLTSQKSMAEFSFKLELQLSKMMEQYLKRYENEHNKQLNAFLVSGDVQKRELLDKFVQIINQCVLKQFSDVVGKIFSIEMQRNLVPMLTAKIDHMQQHIQMDVAQKLTAFDHMLKENIAQVCKSKNIIDAFGKSVLVGVQGSLQAAFIESMSGTLIPAYEKSSQNMFKQLNEAFSVGIKEFMEQFNSYVQHLQPMRESNEEILTVFAGLPQHMDGILATHRNAVNDMMLETRKDMKNMELLIARQTQETIRSELRKYQENQTAALRSQANTPAPMYDAKDTIKLMLSQGQINKAFHQALLANDLSLVEFTLNHADQNTVFTPTCCLEQKVLLSLIQQISADMSNHNEVKQNYLADALLAINLSDPISHDHAPKVLQDLYRNCQKFLMTYPKNPQCSNIRMLMKAVQTYKDQF